MPVVVAVLDAVANCGESQRFGCLLQDSVRCKSGSSPIRMMIGLAAHCDGLRRSRHGHAMRDEGMLDVGSNSPIESTSGVGQGQ